ncbi:MAG TPA: response regulator [Vicinamibacterales bacterium]|jgi:FixJ family two-component response regulator
MAVTDHERRSVIAVVDDDRRVLESLEILLDSADYDGRLFPTGAALLESGELPEIDCLISDVAMPVMDGFALAKAVWAMRPDLPVILITGRPELQHRSPPGGRGPYRVFKKPFNGQELLTAVREALQAPRRHTPS